MQMIVLEDEAVLAIQVTPTPTTTPSYSALMRKITRLGLFMSASDTYAIKSMLLPVLLSQVNSDSEHVAAIALIVTATNTVVTVLVSPIFALNMLAPPTIAQINAPGITPEEHAAKVRDLTTLYRNGLIYSVLALPAILFALNFSEPLFTSVFQQNPAVSNIAAEFLSIYSIAVPATFYYLTTLMMLQSFQYTRALAVGTASMILCLALSIGLGFGIGLPKMGRDGILIGHVAEPFLTSLAFGGFLFAHPKFRNFHFFTSLCSSLQGNLPQFKTMLKTGSVITINVAAEMGFSFGLAAIAGVQSIKSQESLALIMQYTLANAILGVHFPLSGMIILGESMGCEDKKTVYKTAKAALLVALMAGSIIPVVFGITPRSLLAIFSKQDEEIAKVLDVLAPIISVGSLLDVLRVALVFQLRMVGDMKGSTAINVSSQILGLALAFVLGMYTDMGIYGLGAGYSLSVMISCLILTQRWHSKMQPYRQPDATPSSTPSLSSSCCFWGRRPVRDNDIPLHQLDITPM